MRQVPKGNWVGRVSPNWMRSRHSSPTQDDTQETSSSRSVQDTEHQESTSKSATGPSHCDARTARLRGLKWGERALLLGSLTRGHLKARLARPLRQLTLVAGRSCWLMAGAWAGLRLPTERGTRNQGTCWPALEVTQSLPLCSLDKEIVSFQIPGEGTETTASQWEDRQTICVHFS